MTLILSHNLIMNPYFSALLCICVADKQDDPDFDKDEKDTVCLYQTETEIKFQIYNTKSAYCEFGCCDTDEDPCCPRFTNLE